MVMKMLINVSNRSATPQPEFRIDNTDGYSNQELEALNREWEARALDQELAPGTDEYEQAAKTFANEVARR